MPTSTDTEEAKDVPASFFHEQSYPNPFHPSTTIRYHMPHQAFVTLTVYDMLGRTVATLVDGLQAAGIHDASTHMACPVEFICIKWMPTGVGKPVR